MEHPLKRLVDNVRGLTAERVFFLIWSREDVQAKAVELNLKQLGRGEDAVGAKLRPYSDASLGDKFNKPTAANPYLSGGGTEVRLYEDGGFYDSVRVSFISATYILMEGTTEFSGDDGEFVDLSEFSQNLIGLNSASFAIFIEFCMPLLIEIYLKEAKKGV